MTQTAATTTTGAAATNANIPELCLHVFLLCNKSIFGYFPLICIHLFTGIVILPNGTLFSISSSHMTGIKNQTKKKDRTVLHNDLTLAIFSFTFVLFYFCTHIFFSTFTFLSARWHRWSGVRFELLRLICVEVLTLIQLQFPFLEYFFLQKHVQHKTFFFFFAQYREMPEWHTQQMHLIQCRSTIGIFIINSRT